MSTFFSWRKDNKKTLLLGAQTEKLWGFAELPYDARSLARYAGLVLGAVLSLRSRLRCKR